MEASREKLLVEIIVQQAIGFEQDKLYLEYHIEGQVQDKTPTSGYSQQAILHYDYDEDIYSHCFNFPIHFETALSDKDIIIHLELRAVDDRLNQYPIQGYATIDVLKLRKQLLMNRCFDSKLEIFVYRPKNNTIIGRLNDFFLFSNPELEQASFTSRGTSILNKFGSEIETCGKLLIDYRIMDNSILRSIRSNSIEEPSQEKNQTREAISRAQRRLRAMQNIKSTVPL